MARYSAVKYLSGNLTDYHATKWIRVSVIVIFIRDTFDMMYILNTSSDMIFKFL